MSRISGSVLSVHKCIVRECIHDHLDEFEDVICVALLPHPPVPFGLHLSLIVVAADAVECPLEVGLFKMRFVVNHQKDALSSTRKYVMLQRDWTHLSVHHVSGIRVDLRNPLSKLHRVWNRRG